MFMTKSKSEREKGLRFRSRICGCVNRCSRIVQGTAAFDGHTIKECPPLKISNYRKSRGRPRGRKYFKSPKKT